jgi:hypothetical protein
MQAKRFIVFMPACMLRHRRRKGTVFRPPDSRGSGRKTLLRFAVGQHLADHVLTHTKPGGDRSSPPAKSCELPDRSSLLHREQNSGPPSGWSTGSRRLRAAPSPVPALPRSAFEESPLLEGADEARYSGALIGAPEVELSALARAELSMAGPNGLARRGHEPFAAALAGAGPLLRIGDALADAFACPGAEASPAFCYGISRRGELRAAGLARPRKRPRVLPRHRRWPPFDASPAKVVVDGAPRDAELLGEGLAACPLLVSLDDPVDRRLVVAAQRADGGRPEFCVDGGAELGDMFLDCYRQP